MKHLICNVSDIAPNKALACRIGELRVALFRRADGVLHALEDRCPHRGAPLSEGVIYEQFVACRDHGWSICLLDGNVQAPERGAVKVFRVSEEQGQVFVELA